MKEVIGIVGPICAGKDVAGEYISEQMDIPVYQISSPLKEICKERNMPAEMDNLIKTGSELAHKHSDGCLERYILDNLVENRIIITGMRQLGQLALLNAETNLFLLSVDASAEVRFERSKLSGKLGEATDFEVFKRKEIIENSPPNPQRLFDCMQRANFEIINNNSLYYFQKKLDQFIDIANENFKK